MSTKILSGSPESENIDAKLRAWRQGDVALDVDWFVHIANGNQLLTDIEVEEREIGAVTTGAKGVVVVSQTCDIVRNCLKRPFVQVARLVHMTNEQIGGVQRLERPQFLLIPSIVHMGLVGDIDQIMTVEKSIVADWTRSPGCTNDTERRQVADALARHKNRPALPDEFAKVVSPLFDRLRNQRKSQNDEGRAIRALNQIRVTAQPDWSAPEIDLHFWFILGENTDPEIEWEKIVEGWIVRLDGQSGFRTFSGAAVELSDMTADEYVNSDVWDLDRLSSIPS